MSQEGFITRRFSAASSGDNTLISVGTSQRLVLKSARVNVATDVTGDVVLEIGTGPTAEIGGIQNPVAGGNHPVVINGPEGEEYPPGDNLISVHPDTTNLEWTITYKLKDD